MSAGPWVVTWCAEDRSVIVKHQGTGEQWRLEWGGNQAEKLPAAHRIAERLNRTEGDER